MEKRVWIQIEPWKRFLELGYVSKLQRRERELIESVSSSIHGFRRSRVTGVASDFRIQTTWETGLNSYWYKSYRPVREVCRTQDRVLPQNTSLKLEDLSSAFLLLGVGLGLSVLAFLVELTVAARRRRLQAATEEP